MSVSWQVLPRKQMYCWDMSFLFRATRRISHAGDQMPHDAAAGIGPLLSRADHDEPSVFVPESLLREARRQRRLSDGAVPKT